jgi:hypothetical protein
MRGGRRAKERREGEEEGGVQRRGGKERREEGEEEGGVQRRGGRGGRRMEKGPEDGFEKEVSLEVDRHEHNVQLVLLHRL